MTSDVTIVVVDTRSGVTLETRKQMHWLLALGLERVVLAVNNVDLVDFAEGALHEHSESAPMSPRALAQNGSVSYRYLPIAETSETWQRRGAGFIGSHLVDSLLADGISVTVLDNFDSFYERRLKEWNIHQTGIIPIGAWSRATFGMPVNWQYN